MTSYDRSAEGPAARFTIVIPTLQRSPLLPELVVELAASPQVHEILVINNAGHPADFGLAKCRVINLPENIFVNAAWNLGAREARTPLLGLVNDDVLLDRRILGPIARRLDRGSGIIGPAPSMVRDVHAPRRMRPQRPFFVPIYERPYAFGTAMFLRRDDYLQIPDDLKVWRGDDYLFRRQTKRNRAMYGIDIRTHMSTTSGDPAFDAIKEADMEAFQQFHADDPYRLRFWKEFRVARDLRSAWRRGNRVLGRSGAVHR